jgi:hypothetical protein
MLQMLPRARGASRHLAPLFSLVSFKCAARARQHLQQCICVISASGVWDPAPPGMDAALPLFDNTAGGLFTHGFQPIAACNGPRTPARLNPRHHSRAARHRRSAMLLRAVNMEHPSRLLRPQCKRG